MKRYLKYILIFSAILILADLGSKMLIEQFFMPDGDLTQIRDCLHLHPRVNTEDLELFTQKAAEGVFSVPALFLVEILKKIRLAVICCTAIYWISRGLAAVGHPMYGLAAAFITLMVSATACLSLDYILRQGSLDWLCISRTLADGEKIMHMTLDFKDLYLFLFLAVDVIIVARFLWLIVTDKSFAADVENGLKGCMVSLKERFGKSGKQ
ncbi:MAG: hypothetical protein IJX93_03675 [Clostridia bacterium]|nr:hypothetical protein [Clostridia bacterium]